MRRIGLIVALLAAVPAVPAQADAVPYFARKFRVTCARCHVAPPKLNEAGEEFEAAGYQAPDLRARRTWPFAVWASTRTERLPGDVDVNPYVNRVEIITGGRLGSALSYFIEWRAVSLEAQSSGSLRDRSGRFEDLFLSWSGGPLEATVGQFRQIGQIDISTRLGLSEPMTLATGLPGVGGATPRETSLRGFSPSGRSPAVRLAWSAGAGAWHWTASLGVPLIGEFSLPLTNEARVQASNELMFEAKGVVLEAYARRGFTSFGVHAFRDNSERYVANAVTTGGRGPIYWTGVLGLVGNNGLVRGQWSAEAEAVPHRALAAGMRIEDRAADGAPAAFIPYINAHLPGTLYTIRLTLEGRVQRNAGNMRLELAAIF